MKKLRINMIIRRKHLVIAGLAVVLAVGLYANFAIAGGIKPSKETAGNYGDTAFVSADKTDKPANGGGTAGGISVSEEFFAQARIDKQATRQQAAEVLKSIYTGGDITDDEIAVVNQNAQQMAGLIESETAIETLLKAQGFEDVVCTLTEKSANIFVKTDGLDSASAAKIKNALLSEVDIAGENITIIEVK